MLFHLSIPHWMNSGGARLPVIFLETPSPSLATLSLSLMQALYLFRVSHSALVEYSQWLTFSEQAAWLFSLYPNYRIIVKL